MAVSRPWINNLANSNLRNQFQAIVTDLKSFHDHFCKEKNAIFFQGIATASRSLLEALNQATPPDEAAIAGMINSLNTQINAVVAKKVGQSYQSDFDNAIVALTTKITKFSANLNAAIKAYKPVASADDSKVDIAVAPAAGTRAIRQALTTNLTDEQLHEMIDKFEDVPEDTTPIPKRMAKRHPYLTFGGLSALGASAVSVVQTTINAAASVACEAIEWGTLASLKDPRVAVPAALVTVAAVALLTSACKSRPAPRPTKAFAVEGVDTDPLLSAGHASSDVPLASTGAVVKSRT